MKTKKYLVFPGTIISKNDGDKHYISARSIMHLYMVRPEDCIVVDSDLKLRGLDQSDFIHLEPNYIGDYQTFLSDLEKLTKIG